MKKLFLLLSAVFALSATTFAQRIAVVDFNAGVGISQQDVDGIAAIFNTYFSPSGYTLVERTTIDRVIDEQQFQRGKITEQQMVRLGQILNVSKIVIGDVNVVAGEYNIDVRVVNVESGTIAAKDGATWMQGSTYRTLMSELATRLANQIAINPRASQSVSTETSATRNKVEVIYGYLKVFPNELGEFSSEPKTVIEQINKQAMHDYDTWRLPTDEELALLKANGLVGSGKYMRKGYSESGIVVLVTDDEATTVQYSGLGDNGVYKVGYYYNRNGKQGVVFEVSADGRSGKIVSVSETKTTWGPKGTITGATNNSDGKANMSTIKSLDPDLSDYPAFRWCNSYGAGWYLPASNELTTIYDNKSTINATLSAKGYEVLGTGWYWSSTESNSNSAYKIDFSNGDSYYYDYAYKNSTSHVRAVLAF